MPVPVCFGPCRQLYGIQQKTVSIQEDRLGMGSAYIQPAKNHRNKPGA
jgi:hypothetical protein